MRRERYKTNHILHLLLSLITVGLWVPVWVLVAVSNWNERVKVDKKLKEINTAKPGRYMSDTMSDAMIK